MSNITINRGITVDAYGWRCAASFGVAGTTNLVASEMSAFEAFTHGVKRTPATATSAAIRAWNGPIT